MNKKHEDAGEKAVWFMLKKATMMGTLLKFGTLEGLADALDVKRDDLKSIEDGKTRPSAELVSRFKQLCKEILLPGEAEGYLVEPFEPESNSQ